MYQNQNPFEKQITKPGEQQVIKKNFNFGKSTKNSTELRLKTISMYLFDQECTYIDMKSPQINLSGCDWTPVMINLFNNLK